jgi:ABC-2 type transport system permease protein
MRLFLHELRGELLLYVRSRELAFFTFLFPLLLLVILGSAYGDEEINGHLGADYLVGGMIGYGLASTAFAGLGIILVIRREEGLLKRLRATPLPIGTYLAAVLATMVVAFAIEIVCLVALAMLLFDATFPQSVGSLVLAALLGCASFAALGIAVAALIRRAEGASPVINAIYLPLSFLSGAFFSQDSFPGFLQALADVLPLAYFIDLVTAVSVDGQEIWERPLDVGVIAAWGAAGAVLAIRKFRWTPTED